MSDKKVDPELEMFAEAHALYGGRKRFVTTEFKNLKEKHKDWKEVLPMLKGAIQNQIDWRAQKEKSGAFCPEWKQFSNYIDGRWFEEQFPVEKVVSNNTDQFPYI